MPALTVPTIEKYKPNHKRREIPDSKAKGLYLIIQPRPSGRKSWAVRLRRPDGTTAKITLGSVDLGTETNDAPVQGGALTIGQAREFAAQIDRQRARGVDVIAERRAEESRKQTAAADQAANTFGAAAREFIRDHRTSDKRGGKRPRRWREDSHILGLRYPPQSDPATAAPAVIKGGLADVWADKPVAKIDGHDVFGAVNEARKNGGDSRARKLHAALSVLFTFLQRRRRVTVNPAAGVWRPGPPPSRKRRLTDAEIVTFWKACDRLRPPAGAFFKMLLLTGARRSEVAGMSRAELGDDNVWTVPGIRTKNNKPLFLPLPLLARDIIASVQRERFVFTLNDRNPMANFSHLKKLLDAEMAKIAGQPVEPWRIHDLRRTLAYNMGKLGVPVHVTERLLNHISGSFAGIVEVYQGFEYAEEKTDALWRWALHLERMVSGEPSNVVVMPAHRQQAAT
jgi:integrase